MLNVPVKMHARRSMHISLVGAQSSSLHSPRLASDGLSPRFPRHSYFQSPPPSPALPSLLPRHGKKPIKTPYRRLQRAVGAFGLFVVFSWMALHIVSAGRRPATHQSSAPAQYEMVGDSALPHDPSVVMLIDNAGKPRWTVSIPSRLQFPLTAGHYNEICSQAEEVSLVVAEESTGGKRFRRQHLGYYDTDPNYLDVADAEKQGLLGYAKGGSGEQDDGGAALPKCERTLTYVLETGDAGMGSSLMGLWMAYGLAQMEERAFFVDDARWPYGKYSSYFKPAPSPGCAPAPPAQRVPCPHSAAHLVVSAETFPQTFGRAFAEQFEDARKEGVQRQAAIYALARAGYEALFHLADADDESYVQQKMAEMQATRDQGGLTVGLHIRRGDRHPKQAEYREDYIPLVNYMDEARRVIANSYDLDDGASRGHAKATTSFSTMLSEAKNRLVPSAKSKTTPPRNRSSAAAAASKMLLASDDPDIYDAPDVAGTSRAQDRIVLASKAALERASQQQQPQNKYIDEVHGWEGGFFRDQFWGMGRDEDHGPAVSLAAASAFAGRTPPSAAALEMRRMVGRAYLLDLAVLGESDTVVCGISSMGCRLLAVMMGWEKGMVNEAAWRNVDGSFEWRGLT